MGYFAIAHLAFSKPDFSEFLHLNQGGDAFVGDFRSTEIELFEGGIFNEDVVACGPLVSVAQMSAVFLDFLVSA